MNSKTCQNCDVPYGPDDMFCENCGYDFITGSLPVDGGTPSGPVAPAPAATPSPPSAPASGPSSSPPPSSGPATPTSAGATADPSGGRSSGPASGGGASGGTATGDAGSGPVTPATPPSLLDPDNAGDGAESSGAAPAGDGAGLGDVPRLRITVAVDRSFFDEVVNDGEIDFPDPVPVDQELELAGSELHVGRTSESRAIHPDIDVAALTGDQAVSSRHAVIRVANDGAYTIVDVGSTNGTFLDAVESDAITHGVPVEVKPGSAIFVGAWTRLTILD